MFAIWLKSGSMQLLLDIFRLFHLFHLGTFLVSPRERSVMSESDASSLGPRGLADDTGSDLGTEGLHSGTSDVESESSLGPVGVEPTASSRSVSAAARAPIETTASSSVMAAKVFTSIETTASSSSVIVDAISPIETTASSSSMTGDAISPIGMTSSSSSVIVDAITPIETTASSSIVTSHDSHVLAHPCPVGIKTQVLPLLQCSNSQQVTLAQALAQPVEQVRKQLAQDIDNCADYVAGPRPRPLISTAAECRILEVGEKDVQRLVSEQFVTADQLSLFFYNSAAARLEQRLLQSDDWEPVAAVENVGNDETSFYLDDARKHVRPRSQAARPASEQPEDRQQQRQYDLVVSKLMAVHIAWSFVIKDRKSGRRFQVIFKPPARTLLMDRNTGETTRESIQRVRQLFNQLESLMRLFPCHRGHNNDRAGQNDRSFSQQAAADTNEDGKSIVNIRVGCDTHDCQNAQTHQYDSVPLLISNCLHTGLLFKQKGALDYFRKGVSCLFRARKTIVVGQPPPGRSSPDAKHRGAILDSFLPLKSGTHNRRRRAILDSFLNGPWTERRIYHFCLGQCCEDADTDRIFDDYVLPALLPHNCPSLQRSKWLGCDGAVDWIGLLSNCCFIFDDVIHHVEQCLKNPDYELSEELFKLAEDFPEWMVGEDAHGDLVLDSDDDDEGGPEQEEFAGDETMPKLADGSPDWATFNHRVRKRCSMFAKTRPGTELALLRTCKEPLAALHRHLIWMSGTGWCLNNIRLQESGLPPKVKLAECAKGNVTKEFWLATEALFFSESDWAMIAPVCRTQKMQARGFKLVSKGAGAIKVLLDARHARFPTKLFKTVFGSEEEILDVQTAVKDKCVLDAETLKHLQLVDSDLSSERSQDLLSNTGSLMENTINFIEYGHAPLRKIAHNCVSQMKRKFCDVAQDIGLLRHRQNDLGLFFQSKKHWTKKDFKKDVKQSQKPLSMKPRQIRRRALRAAQGKEHGRINISTSWTRHLSHRADTPGRFFPRVAQEQSASYRAMEPAARMVLGREAKGRSRMLRAVSSLKRRNAPTKHRALVAEPSSDSDAPGREESQIVVALDRHAMKPTLARLQKAQRHDNAARVANKKARRSQATTWMKDLNSLPEAKEQGGNLTWERTAGIHNTMILQAPTGKLAAYVNKRLSPAQKDALIQHHHTEVIQEVKHAECPQLDNISSCRLTPCQLAVECVCSGRRSIIGRFTAAFIAYQRQWFPPKTALRRALKQGCIVLKLAFDLAEGMQESWWHVSYINLQNFLSCLLHLERVPIGPSCDDARASVALRVCRPCRFLLPWHAFTDLILGRERVAVSCTAYVVLEHRFVRVTDMDISRVDVRPVLAQQYFWPRAPGAAGSSSDGDVAPPPLDFAEVAPEAGVIRLVSEDDPVDLAAHLLDQVAIAELGIDEGLEADAGDKGKGKGKAPGPMAEERAAYHADEVHHKDDGSLLGIVRIWEKQKTLTARCERCKYRINKKHREWGGRGDPQNKPQGRPMGALLLWLHLPCDGISWQHADKWKVECLPCEDRKKLREHFSDLGQLELQFEAERDPFPFELGGEPVGLC